ncbi:MAG: CotH kinase family protein [Saprospiraceae bacterium]
MKNIIACLLLLICNSVKAQKLPSEVQFSTDGKRLITGISEVAGLYNTEKLRRVDLIFDQPDYWTQLTNNYQSKKDIVASLIIDGVTYPNVGVRFKGQTSYSRVTSQKKSFNVTMDFLDPEQDLKGYQTLNFNNAFEDNSCTREVLYENITRPFCPSLKANFIHLYINGQDWGLYPNVQALDGAYIKEWFLSNDGTRWRCERTTGGMGGFGAGTSTLNYLGDDTSSYKPHYTLKHTTVDNPWADLARVTKVLNTVPLAQLEDSLNKVFDIDRALWFLAKEILFGDDDSYVNKGGMDYYAIYQKDVERLIPLEYDANSVMKGQTTNWSIFLKEADVKFPLTNRLFAVPALRQRYLAHVRSLFNATLDSTYFTNYINTFYNHIDSVVTSDPKKFMTYSAFQAEKNVLINWMRSRRTFVLNNTEFKQIGATISDVQFLTNGVPFKTPDETQEVTIQATISGNIAAKQVNLYFAPGYDGYFNKIVMYDDGNHNDNQAKDGIYAASIPAYPNGNFIRYYIESIANNTAGTTKYSPEGAEHDVYIYQVELKNSSATEIVINEFMASNSTTMADQDGEFDDWIELYNNSNKEIDISNWILTDNPTNLDKYRFPYGTNLIPDSYLIIWADENGKQTGYHANFKLSASGEEIILLDSLAQQVDKVSFGAQLTDKGYARKPNGSGSFIVQAPTFNKNNDLIITNYQFENSSITIVPNPASKWIQIHTPFEDSTPFSIYNLIGNKVLEGNYINKNLIDVSLLSTGLYVIKIESKSSKFIIR